MLLFAIELTVECIIVVAGFQTIAYSLMTGTLLPSAISVNQINRAALTLPTKDTPTSQNTHTKRMNISLFDKLHSRTTLQSTEKTFAPVYRTSNAMLTSILKTGPTTYPLTTTYAEHLPTRIHVNVGAIMTDNDRYIFSFNRSAPALDYAINVTIKELGILPDVQLAVKYTFDECFGYDGVSSAIRLYNSYQVNILLGPVCEFSAIPVFSLAATWNVPLLTSGIIGDIHFKHHAILTTTTGQTRSLGIFLEQVMGLFSWREMQILYDEDGYDHVIPKLCRVTTSDILTYLTSRGKNVFAKQIHSHDIKNLDLIDAVGNTAAVVLFCLRPSSVIELMKIAHNMNFDNGEYVFLLLDLYSNHLDERYRWFHRHELDVGLLDAYRMLFAIREYQIVSPNYTQFSDAVIRNAKSFYNFEYNETRVNTFVGGLHDSLVMYAHVLNETLAANGNIHDGIGITARMRDRTFHGVTGTVHTDKFGRRTISFLLLDLNIRNGEYEEVLHFDGLKSVIVRSATDQIDWGTGRSEPPPSIPLCGYSNNKCKKHAPSYLAKIYTGSSIGLLLLITAFLVLRRVRPLENKTPGLWLFTWDEVMSDAGRKGRRHQFLGRHLNVPSKAIYNKVSTSSLERTKKGAKLVNFRGCKVIILQLKRSRFRIDKNCLKEVRTVMQLQNDHICRFVGACLEPPNQCLMYEYCQKGSLRDILSNVTFDLDWMFKFSLIDDLSKGVEYIHASDVVSHGNLSSETCFIDSRFVLQISLFGLHSLFDVDEEPKSNFSQEFVIAEDLPVEHYENKLWSSPELLRDSNRPPRGTQKGDIYSFGLVCQDIIYRQGVFFIEGLPYAYADIYKIVKQKDFAQPLRPTMEPADCPSPELAAVITGCWNEKPETRPDIASLRSIIRKWNRGNNNGSILDNLLQRLEHYANNLESVVEEKTARLLDAKKNAEELLYMMLPKKVARILMAGETAAAEAFECVTIYFSDICDFTHMSASSTPMQVIELLNNLYSMFDEILENYDVYKVETIGDAYMVASGIPELNGNLHAREIARLALALLDAMHTFRIPHLPHEKLKLRIGIHTGPVCSGVIGQKMPRYCLFGDTVNTASRVESTGVPLRIHMSNSTKEILDLFGTFESETRGEIQMKGKGLLLTHWLIGENTDTGNFDPLYHNESEDTRSLSSLPDDNMFHRYYTSERTSSIPQSNRQFLSEPVNQESNQMRKNSFSNSGTADGVLPKTRTSPSDLVSDSRMLYSESLGNARSKESKWDYVPESSRGKVRNLQSKFPNGSFFANGPPRRLSQDYIQRIGYVADDRQDRVGGYLDDRVSRTSAVSEEHTGRLGRLTEDRISNTSPLLHNGKRRLSQLSEDRVSRGSYVADGRIFDLDENDSTFGEGAEIGHDSIRYGNNERIHSHRTDDGVGHQTEEYYDNPSLRGGLTDVTRVNTQGKFSKGFLKKSSLTSDTALKTCGSLLRAQDMSDFQTHSDPLSRKSSPSHKVGHNSLHEIEEEVKNPIMPVGYQSLTHQPRKSVDIHINDTCEDLRNIDLNFESVAQRSATSADKSFPRGNFSVSEPKLLNIPRQPPGSEQSVEFISEDDMYNPFKDDP